MEKIIIPKADILAQRIVEAARGRDLTIMVEHAGSVSDGFHSFDELYDHRTTLFIALCRVAVQTMAWAAGVALHDQPEKLDSVLSDLRGSYKNSYPWRSKVHGDGSAMEGWFIMGIGKERGTQISYHLPVSRWEETNFAETLDRAPEWDGHTSADVLERLKAL